MAGFGSDGAARRALNLVKIDDGTHVDRYDISVAEYLRGRIERAALDLRPTTTVGHRRPGSWIVGEPVGGLARRRI